jgi:pimeloyl-ACP methyl ester carboxylesterase
MSKPPPASTIYLCTPPEPGKKAAKLTYIIYFLTGNPGLVEYYRTFLTHLYGLLSRDTSTSRDVEFQVYSRSLSGFEMSTSDIKTAKWHKMPPYGLQDQIRHAEEDVTDLVEAARDAGGKDVRVILVGHSVGAYLGLEIVRRLRAHGLAGEDYETRISGCVGVFPTVVDIARSESGMKASVRIICLGHCLPANHMTKPFLKNSNFALIASMIVSFLTMLLPITLLSKLVAAVMDFPEDAAHTTASFIKSPHGIQQALHMARDEMFQIDTDIWDEDVWGAAAEGPQSQHPHPRPVLRFLFAKKDQWVANGTRDSLIRTRGRVSYGDVDEVEGMGENWKPIMEIDEREGWPHGFCIRHGVPVAEKVAGYVKSIVRQDMGKK